jgi:hypothetical protein
MTPRQEKLLEKYRELWAELNAVNALISELEDKRRDIKAKQRSLANAIAADEEEE